jgi:ubiquinone/menaquinone biosynthesis C-methylase UbiE
MVVARVSLPYSNLPAALREVRRVLAPRGGVWLTLHPLPLVWKQAQGRNWKGWIFFGYVVLNSVLFHLAGKQFPYVTRRYESFQTEGGMRRSLRKLGFENISMEKSKERFLVTARLRE